MDNQQLKSHAPPRFNLLDPNEANGMLEYLSKNGYAVVANVANEEQIKTAKLNFWDFVESKRPLLKQDQIQTWSGDNWLPNQSNGILGQFGFSHSDFVWNTRLLPRVSLAFEKIWKTNDLICSFDGGNSFRPWKYNPEWLTEGGWWHVDQNSLNRPHRKGQVCVQGLVTYYDATCETGGLCVVPKSHQSHDQLCSRVPAARTGMDFVTIPDGDQIFKNGSILVEAKAGDLILWDSRTVHCNSPALTVQEYFSKERLDQDNFNLEIIRLVGYVCMLPYSHATPQVIEQRKSAFINHIGTSHWPNCSIIFGTPSKFPRDINLCSKEMLRLVGYRD